jgi:hypothetical protein
LPTSSPAPATQAIPVPCTCPTPFLPRCPADHLPGTLDEGITPRQGLSGTAVRGSMVTKGLRGHVHRPNRLSPPSPQLIAFTASWPWHREALCLCLCPAALCQLTTGARYLAPRAPLFLRARLGSRRPRPSGRIPKKKQKKRINCVTVFQNAAVSGQKTNHPAWRLVSSRQAHKKRRSSCGTDRLAGAICRVRKGKMQFP